MIKSNSRALAELKVRMYSAKFGSCTSADALECAIRDDVTFRNNGPFDPAAGYFSRMSHEWLSYASALEELGQ